MMVVVTEPLWLNTSNTDYDTKPSGQASDMFHK